MAEPVPRRLTHQAREISQEIVRIESPGACVPTRRLGHALGLQRQSLWMYLVSLQRKQAMRSETEERYAAALGLRKAGQLLGTELAAHDLRFPILSEVTAGTVEMGNSS